jgi:hypothetical protein
MSVTANTRRVSPSVTVEVEVKGAPERKRSYGKYTVIPDLLVIRYGERASGWGVDSVTLYGARVLKKGIGARYSDQIWQRDLPNEEQWVKDAIRDNRPNVSLR